MDRFYAIVVVRTAPSENQTLYDEAGPFDSDVSYYITAAWSGENITKVPEMFTIGNESVTYADGSTFVNVRLREDTSYTIFVWIDLESDLVCFESVF